MALEANFQVAIPASAQNQLSEQWDTVNNIEAYLASIGLHPPPLPPGDRPIIRPDDYVHIEGEQYGRLMGAVDVWWAYDRGRLAYFRSAHICTKNEMKVIAADMRRDFSLKVSSGSAKKMTQSEQEDNILANPRYRSLMLLCQNLDIAIERAETLCDAGDRFRSGLSRQVTLRGQEIEMGNANQGKRGGPRAW